MNLKKMCASHNLILLVSLVTLALVIVLVVKQEREQFSTTLRGGESRDERRRQYKKKGQIANWGNSGKGQKGTSNQPAKDPISNSLNNTKLAPGANGGN